MEVSSQLSTTQSTTIPQTIQQKIHVEMVKLLYHHLKVSQAGSALCATLLVIALYYSTPFAYLAGWYASLISVTCLRLASLHFFKHRTLDFQTIRPWRILFIVGSVISAALWGIGSIWLMPLNNFPAQALIIILIGGISGSAIQTLSSDRIVANAFIILVLAPLIIWLSQQTGYAYNALTVTVIVYTLLLLAAARRSYIMSYQSFQLHVENSELIETLSAAKTHLEQVNQNLFSEIKERELAETSLRNSEDQIRLITNALPVLISYIDTNYCLRFTNKAYEEWFDKPQEQINGHTIQDIFPEPAYTDFCAHIQIALNKPEVSYETTLPYKNAKQRHLSATLIQHCVGSVVKGFIALLTDITDYKEAEERLSYLATHDTLTDLPNRSLLNNYLTYTLARAERSGKPFAVLFLDVDHFKNVNDTLGHDAGDNLLVDMAKVLLSCLRSVDFVARLSGDEFTIVVEDIANKQEVAFLAERICQKLRNAFHYKGEDIFVTISIGISIYPEDGATAQLLLKNADIAMYHAKDAGRNNYQFFMRGMHESLSQKLVLEKQLRKALEQEDFTLSYQPIIDVKTNKIIGAEALLRWPHINEGLISPTEFIPLSEELGLIVPLGKWVLQTACRQNQQWQTQGFKIPISVNVSARQFYEPKLVDMVAEVITNSGLPPEFLTLEVTETFLMRNIEQTIATLQALKKLGIRISLDDFGTGYSTFGYLQRFPVDSLKIDRSFITDITTNPENAAIAKAIIEMAHSLNIKVIAEGVETKAQFEFLAQQHCDAIQGYFMAMPLPEAEFEKLVREWDVQHREDAKLV